MNLSTTTTNGKHGMTDKKPLRKGQGRRQFIACHGRIKELISQGYDISMVYEALRDEGLITMSYGGFYDLVTQRKRRKKQKMNLLEPIPDSAPLFPITAPMQPTVSSNPALGGLDDQPIPTIREKQTALTPQPSGVGTGATDKEERRRKIQDSLSKNLKASEKFINESASESDSERDEMAERLI